MADLIIQEKTCTGCGTTKPTAAFAKHKMGRFGVRARCRDCIRQAYFNNKEANKEKRKTYYRTNAEQIIARQKKHREANIEEARRKARENYWRRPDEMRIRNRANYKKNPKKYIDYANAYHQAHKEQVKETMRRWRQRNPERHRLFGNKNRVMRHGRKGKFTRQQLLDKYAYHGWRCYLCKLPITLKTSHADHRTPLARGGSNWIANIAPACAPCNLKKNRRTESEYRAFLVKP